MFKHLKFTIANTVINFSFFTLLIIGMQNSSISKRVNLIFFETIKLPTSFIVGTSFIIGSISGSIVSLSSKKNKED